MRATAANPPWQWSSTTRSECWFTTTSSPPGPNWPTTILPAGKSANGRPLRAVKWAATAAAAPGPSMWSVATAPRPSGVSWTINKEGRSGMDSTQYAVLSRARRPEQSRRSSSVAICQTDSCRNCAALVPAYRLIRPTGRSVRPSGNKSLCYRRGRRSLPEWPPRGSRNARKIPASPGTAAWSRFRCRCAGHLPPE